jgi:hypothetical protein
VTAVREKATWCEPALGVARELELPQGRLRYFESIWDYAGRRDGSAAAGVNA